MTGENMAMKTNNLVIVASLTIKINYNVVKKKNNRCHKLFIKIRMNDYLINIYLECYFNEFLKISANNIQETAKKSINEANIFQIEAIY